MIKKTRDGFYEKWVIVQNKLQIQKIIGSMNLTLKIEI